MTLYVCTYKNVVNFNAMFISLRDILQWLKAMAHGWHPIHIALCICIACIDWNSKYKRAPVHLWTLDSGLSTSTQVQAVTSVGPGNFSEPMTVVVTPSSDSSSNPTVIVVVVVVIVVIIIVLCSVAAGLLAYIFWWAAQHEACMHAQCMCIFAHICSYPCLCLCVHAYTDAVICSVYVDVHMYV